MIGKYDDIINLPHYVSPTKPKMSMMDRAAQFSPFAALTGYDAAISETGRLTDSRIELTEEELDALNSKYQSLMDTIGTDIEVSIVYFKPDDRKSGGTYLTIRDVVKKVDIYERWILMHNGTCIPMDDIFDIDLSGSQTGEPRATER